MAYEFPGWVDWITRKNRTSKELSEQGKESLRKVLESSELTTDEITNFLSIATEQSVRDLHKLISDTKKKIKNDLPPFGVIEESGKNKTEPVRARRDKNDAIDKARYLFIKQIGIGGQAIVDVGYDLLLGRLVALKIIEAPDTENLALAQAEASLMARYSGTERSVLSIYDFREINDPRLGKKKAGVAVMEYMDPNTSREMGSVFSGGETLAPKDVMKFTADMTMALRFYHKRGIRHLDIKPGNIFEVEEGGKKTYKLTDFGMASKTKFAVDYSTPAYAAPETFVNEPLSSATDVWSLALTTLSVMTGKRLFNLNDGIKGEMQQIHDVGTRIVSFESESQEGTQQIQTFLLEFIMKQYPQYKSSQMTERLNALTKVFQKALRQDTKRRYKTPKEFSDALTAALT